MHAAKSLLAHYEVVRSGVRQPLGGGGAYKSTDSQFTFVAMK